MEFDKFMPSAGYKSHGAKTKLVMRYYEILFPANDLPENMPLQPPS